MSPLVRARSALIVALALPAPAAAQTAADAIVTAVQDPALRVVLDDVLARNPEIAAARARALAAAQMAPQETALPDPWLMVTAIPRSAEAQAAVEVRQEVPAAGKRRLRGEAAGLEAEAAADDLQAMRLERVGEARDTWLEIAYLEEAARIAREERETLVHFESLARARYAAGEGLQQDALRLQAEITRAELELVELESERHVAIVALNALRGWPGRLDLASPALPPLPEAAPSAGRLAQVASGLRPDLRAAETRVRAAGTRVELARRERSPDVMLSGAWTFMRGGMDGRSGLGNDEAMLGVGISLPVRGRRLDAMLQQAVFDRDAADAERDAAAQAIEREATQLCGRLDLTLRQLRLNEGVLAIQAAEALRSAESAYATGMVGSIELLDAERELFGIRRGAARARADAAMLVARLEGVLGAPLSLLDAAAGEPSTPQASLRAALLPTPPAGMPPSSMPAVPRTDAAPAAPASTHDETPAFEVTP